MLDSPGMVAFREAAALSEVHCLMHRGAASSPRLTVGLVNNMLGGAHERTELQFRKLIAAASGDLNVQLAFFSTRGGVALDGSMYHNLEALETYPLDAIIVTGSPPCTELLVMEPLWASFNRVVDIARSRALPTIWSCLAAHAAMFQLDGLHRRKLPRKISGLYECRPVDDHHVLASQLPRRWFVPHSRCNDVPVEWLEARGYRPVVLSDEAGADTCVKEFEAMFVFFQGHPEYDRETLLLEYKRDVRKFLSGERDDYPGVPANYFARETNELVLEFRERALRRRFPELMGYFPPVSYAQTAGCDWSEPAVQIYANWLSYVAETRLPSAIRVAASSSAI